MKVEFDDIVNFDTIFQIKTVSNDVVRDVASNKNGVACANRNAFVERTVKRGAPNVTVCTKVAKQMKVDRVSTLEIRLAHAEKLDTLDLGDAVVANDDMAAVASQMVFARIRRDSSICTSEWDDVCRFR